MKLILRVALQTMTVFALGAIGDPAGAEPYPAKPIGFVAPYPPGSVTDLLARIIAQKLTDKWGQPVIVENRGRGGSVIGTEVVAKAPPHGYSILMVAPELTINESLRSKLRRQGIEPMISTPNEFAVFLRSDIKKWGELVRRTGARITSRPAYASAMPPAGSEGGQPASA